MAGTCDEALPGECGSHAAAASPASNARPQCTHKHPHPLTYASWIIDAQHTACTRRTQHHISALVISLATNPPSRRRYLKSSFFMNSTTMSLSGCIWSILHTRHRKWVGFCGSPYIAPTCSNRGEGPRKRWRWAERQGEAGRAAEEAGKGGQLVEYRLNVSWARGSCKQRAGSMLQPVIRNLQS